MRIYTEVIMEWDEEKQAMVEVSSESYEYEGDVALCGKQTSNEDWQGRKHDPKWGTSDASPGLAAIMTQKLPTSLGGVSRAHPTKIPGSAFDVPTGHSQLYGDANIQVGSALPEIDYGAISRAPAQKYSWKGFKGRQKSYPRRDVMRREAEPYSEAFREQWYNPYKHAAISRPIQSVAEEELMEARDIQGVHTDALDALGGLARQPMGFGMNLLPGGLQADYGLRGKVAAPVDLETGVRSAVDDLETAKQSYLDFEEETTRKRGLLDAEQIAADERGETIDTDEQEMYVDHQTALEDRENQRLRDRAGIARGRGELLADQLSRYEEAIGRGSGGGFARSGPSQRAYQSEVAKEQAALGEATAGARGIERGYHDDVAELGDRLEGSEQAIEDRRTKLHEDIHGIGGIEDQRANLAYNLEQEKGAWDTAKQGYRDKVRGLGSTVDSTVKRINNWLGTLGQSHRSLGEEITGYPQDAAYGTENMGMGYNLKYIRPQADIYQEDKYGAPEGGWFGETGRLREVDEGYAATEALSELGREFSRLDEDKIIGFLKDQEQYDPITGELIGIGGDAESSESIENMIG